MRWIAAIASLPVAVGVKQAGGAIMKQYRAEKFEGADSGAARSEVRESPGSDGLLRQALAAASRSEAIEVASHFAPATDPAHARSSPDEPADPVTVDPNRDGNVSGNHGSATRDGSAAPTLEPAAGPLIATPVAAVRQAAASVEVDQPTQRPGRMFPARPAALPRASIPAEDDGTPRTQLVRGKRKVGRANFFQDPVVGWLVVVGGPGLGAFRPIFEGNNTLGRARTQRVPIDFGDDAISSEEQAYIRYDSSDRTFLLVPNLAKTNIVSLNDRKPTSAVPLQAMDLITVGRTQLVFMPFCGVEFDWADLGEMKD